MNDQDEQFLSALHEKLDKRAIEIDDHEYLDLHAQPGEVSGTDAVTLLARSLTIAVNGLTAYRPAS